MRKLYETALILIGTIGWWGFVYPDMCLTEDVYEQECEEDQTEIDASELMNPEQMPVRREMSSADAAEDTGLVQSGWKIGDIRIKSRIVEYLYQER
ncbi:MAG: hypothetical protein HDQ97_16650 [Lachnospiraceae bacterium]|nr:hypothetical protein [Lachnospiraceae bacterium]